MDSQKNSFDIDLNLYSKRETFTNVLHWIQWKARAKVFVDERKIEVVRTIFFCHELHEFLRIIKQYFLATDYTDFHGLLQSISE
jgi:hypothetical protein